MSNLRSGQDLVETPVPDIAYRIEGLLRAKGGRMSITGQAKMKKSFLAMDMALRIAAGDDWFGFKTKQGKVLYVNLEISGEKFQERIQDIQSILQYDSPVLNSFKEITILNRNLALDECIANIQTILDQCRANGFVVDTIFLDPRARSVSGSENEELVIKRFCDNVDKLLTANQGLSTVIITHMDKDSTKGAIGHSRDIAWVDTEVKISKHLKEENHNLLEITGRDAEQVSITLNFKYPLHAVDNAQQMIRKSRVDEAKEYILKLLGSKPQPQQQLRQQAMQHNITHYAYSTAIAELKTEKRIKSVQVKGPGNKKILKLDSE
jgi:hypothetical protein